MFHGAVVLHVVLQIALVQPLHGGLNLHGHHYFFGPDASRECLEAAQQLQARIETQYQMNVAAVCKPFNQTDAAD